MGLHVTTIFPPAPPAGLSLNDIAAEMGSHLNNGCMSLWERQVPTTDTLRTSVGGRVYSADRWAISTANASGFNCAQVFNDGTIGAVQAGLRSKFYGRFTAVTNAQKLCVSQVVENTIADSLRGVPVTFQCTMRKTGGALTVRLGLLQLQSTGAANTIPSGAGLFITAFNAAATDPTFGANLALVAPTTAFGTGATVVGNAVSCPLTNVFQTFAGVFTPPSNCLNVIPVLFTDGNIAAADQFHVGELGAYQADTIQNYVCEDISINMLRCRRYFQKTFGVGTAPATNAGLGIGEAYGLAGKAGAVANSRGIIWRLATRMFVTPPTITLFNPSAANAQARDTDAAADCSATAVSNATDQSINVSFTGAAGTAVGNSIAVHMTLESEL